MIENLVDKIEWFYEHDVQWQNDMELYWRENGCKGSLEVWTYHQFH